MQSKSPVRAVLTMKRQTGAERRLHPRYGVNPGLPKVAVALQGLHKQGHELLQAQMQNLSTGGLCLLGDRAVELSQVFRRSAIRWGNSIWNIHRPNACGFTWGCARLANASMCGRQ